MNFPIEIKSRITDIPNCPEVTININSPVTTFVGPNGSGKTQFLRSLRQPLRNMLSQNGVKGVVRFLSAGRLSHLEQFRSNFDGRRGERPNYQEVTFGPKSFSQYRHNSETAYGDFHTLSERPDIQIKIGERLRRIFHRDVHIDWDGGNLKVFFLDTENSTKEYPSSMEASGLLNLVSILAALYDDEVSVLLIDEPEVSLHPQLQAFVLQEIRRIAGDPNKPGKKLVFIATHSPAMIHIQKPQDLCSFLFCEGVERQPIQVPINAGELQRRKIKELVARMGQEHKNAFFSARPLLVEGPSDMIMAKALDHKCEIYLEPAGAQIIPVIGKGEMPTVVKFMRLMGKSPVVLADADAFTDSLDFIQCFYDDDAAQKEAKANGHPDLHSFAKGVYSDFCQAVLDHWDFIESIASANPYYKPDADGVYTDKVKRRCAFSMMNRWPDQPPWDDLKTRIDSLFKVLTHAGCFILRKGAIEQYYQSPDAQSEGVKPTAAVIETEFLMTLETSAVEEKYSDILKALRFAGQKVKLDETGELKNYLLSACAPILRNISNGNLENPNNVAKRFIHEKSTLFDFEIIEGKKQLKVGIKSNIIDAIGFPLVFSANENPINTVESNIKTKYPDTADNERIHNQRG